MNFFPAPYPDLPKTRSYLVHGPQGCGKTKNASRILRALHLQYVHEGLPLRHKQFSAEGVLYLCNEVDSEWAALFLPSHIISFDEAMEEVFTHEIQVSGNILMTEAHKASFNAGWWSGEITPECTALQHVQQNTRIGKALVAEKLCLIHSEISEGMEGHRKGLMDDKLPHRTMLEVELADAVIRIADLAGALNFDLGGAIAEKMKYNAVRPDHKKEARESAGGKSY